MKSLIIVITDNQLQKLTELVQIENQIPSPTIEDITDFVEALVVRETEI